MIYSTKYIKLKISRYFIILICLAFHISMQAQLPKHIKLQELDLSFDILDGWSGQVEGEYFF